MPVQLFLDKVSHADESVEANVSTIFQSIQGRKQYWFLRSSELRCMLWNGVLLPCFLHSFVLNMSLQRLETTQKR